MASRSSTAPPGTCSSRTSSRSCPQSSSWSSTVELESRCRRYALAGRLQPERLDCYWARLADPQPARSRPAARITAPRSRYTSVPGIWAPPHARVEQRPADEREAAAHERHHPRIAGRDPWRRRKAGRSRRREAGRRLLTPRWRTEPPGTAPGRAVTPVPPASLRPHLLCQVHRAAAAPSTSPATFHAPPSCTIANRAPGGPAPRSRWSPSTSAVAFVPATTGGSILHRSWVRSMDVQQHLPLLWAASELLEAGGCKEAAVCGTSPRKTRRGSSRHCPGGGRGVAAHFDLHRRAAGPPCPAAG